MPKTAASAKLCKDETAHKGVSQRELVLVLGSTMAPGLRATRSPSNTQPECTVARRYSGGTDTQRFAFKSSYDKDTHR